MHAKSQWTAHPVPPSAPHGSGLVNTPLLAARRTVEVAHSRSRSSEQPSSRSSSCVSSEASAASQSRETAATRSRRDHHVKTASWARQQSLFQHDSSDSDEADHKPIRSSDSSKGTNRAGSDSSSISDRSSSTAARQQSHTSQKKTPQEQEGIAPSHGLSSAPVKDSMCVLPDLNVGNILPTSVCTSSHDQGHSEMLELENGALKRKLTSFEQQHRFMMSALDREYHLKVKEQERQRTVLRAELDDVLKQLKFSQFECKDKLTAAEARVEEERRKTAEAERLKKQAQHQRNQLVAQVAALRAQLSHLSSQSCFSDMSDLLHDAGVRHSPADDAPTLCSPALSLKNPQDAGTQFTCFTGTKVQILTQL